MTDGVDHGHENHSFATRAVHSGERPRHPDFTPTTTPIYATTSFSYAETATLEAVFGQERHGYVYTRYGNPTVGALEAAVAALEGTEGAIALASGMAALHAAILVEVQAGSRIVAASDLYGATRTLLVNVFGTLGIKTTFVDPLDLDAVRAAVDAVGPRLVLLETISNPLLRVPDLAAIVEIAHAARARVVVDNTFATPYLVSPAAFGADIVVHSATKYLAGHGDVIGGVIATTEDRVLELGELTKLTGAILGPFEAWLTLRGIKTLPLRVRRQSDNAARVAAWLSANDRIGRVFYPGHDDLGDRARLFNHDLRGGLVAFEIAGAGTEGVARFLQAMELCVPATTLGDVYTLALSPAMATHRGLTPDERAAIGIGDDLVRLALGIEDPADIIADLDHALSAVPEAR